MPVIGVEVQCCEPYETGIAGLKYERLDGSVTFGVDPGNAANELITDLHLVPTDRHGLVQFSSDFCLLHNPADEFYNACGVSRVSPQHGAPPRNGGAQTSS